MEARRSGSNILLLICLVPLFHILLGVIFFAESLIGGNGLGDAAAGFATWVLVGWISYLFVSDVPSDMTFEVIGALVLSLLIMWPWLKGKL